MTFTPEQELILKEIITAYQNGKRLNELPHIGDVNPLDLIVEVLDTGGESKQSKIAALLPYLEEQCAYGIQWDTSVSSSNCTRIGSTVFHKSLPIQNRLKGCLLDDNGNVVEYLNPKNWRGHILDGSAGQVMVEIPTHYRKFETVGTMRSCKISEYPLPGYHCVHKMYISAYEATMQRSTGKLCSVANNGSDYRGGNNQSGWDGSYRSVLGRPVTVKSRTSFRNGARLRNSSATSEWNCLDYNAYKAIFWLYNVEYANRNCQLPFNAQKDANGYAQGGLGNGVTTLSPVQWSQYNGYYPFVPCGYSDDLGNASGELAYTLLNSKGSTFKTVYVPRYRGVENPFGHIWKWSDGINIQIASEADGGLSTVYVADEPSAYNDSNYNGYSNRGQEVRSNGYVTELVFGESGDIMPAIVGGGSTTHWADYHHTSIPDSGTSLRCALFGGHTVYGATAGFGFADSNHAPSFTSAAVGSRLCFLPK